MASKYGQKNDSDGSYSAALPIEDLFGEIRRPAQEKCTKARIDSLGCTV